MVSGCGWAPRASRHPSNTIQPSQATISARLSHGWFAASVANATTTSSSTIVAAVIEIQHR